MTPEMWLDLEPIPHRASCNFAADRQNPSGIQHGVALLVAWLDISRSTREGCHLLSCDVCHGWEGWDTKFFHDLHAVSLGLRRWFCGVSQALMSPARRRRNGQGAALSAG